MLSAYKKSPGAAKYARVDLDRNTADFRVYELILPPELEEKLLAQAVEGVLGALEDGRQREEHEEHAEEPQREDRPHGAEERREPGVEGVEKGHGVCQTLMFTRARMTTMLATRKAATIRQAGTK